MIVLTYFVARVLSWFVRRASSNANWDVQLVLLLGRVFYVLALAIGFLTLLYVVAPNLVGPALGLVGLLGLAFGLAFQDILRNWLSGFFLLVERPFRIGDMISVGNYTGTVETVELRATVLRTVEGVKVIVPNQMVFSAPLSNKTFYQLRQTVTAVPVPPERHPAHLLPEARAELDRVTGIAKEPAPRVALVPRAEDTALEARYWIDRSNPDADAVEREAQARLVFVVAGSRIGGADVAALREAPFLRQPVAPPAPPKVTAPKIKQLARMVESRVAGARPAASGKKPAAALKPATPAAGKSAAARRGAREDAASAKPGPGTGRRTRGS